MPSPLCRYVEYSRIYSHLPIFSRPFLLSFLCPVSHTAADLNFRRHGTFTGRAHRFHCIETTAVPRPHRICIKILEHSNHVKIWAQADLQRHPPHLGIALKRKVGCWGAGLPLNGSLASAAGVGLCFPPPVLRNFVCLKESTCFLPAAQRDERRGVLPTAVQLEKSGVWRLKALLSRTRYSDCRFGVILL